MTKTTIPLVRIAHARSGDKADWVDFGLFAWNLAGYRLIEREVTAERVRAHFAPWLPGEVDAWALPHILALKLVLKGALQGGGAHGAFQWGVLDRLLEDDRLDIQAVTAAYQQLTTLVSEHPVARGVV